MAFRVALQGRSRRDRFSVQALAITRARSSKARVATVAGLISTYRQKHGREPTPQEIAQTLCCSAAKVARYLEGIKRLNR